MIFEEAMNAFVNAVFDRFKKKMQENGAVEREITHNDDVYKKLRTFFTWYPCDRLLVIQYHNGSNFYNGRSIQKTSCTYEVNSPGVSSVLRDIQNILSSEDPEFHASIAKNKIVKYETIDQCPNPVKRIRLMERGVKSYYAMAITDLNDNLLGYICCEYTAGSHIMTAEHEDALTELANQLSGYLSIATEPIDPRIMLSERLIKLLIILVFLLATGEVVDLFIRARQFFEFMFGI
jgi:hypothetical protein